MENYSYICGAELDIFTTNTDLGGVPSLHIRSNMSDSAISGEHRFLCTYF